jgi:GNAT superfamily N-acetyltransferase
MHRIHVNEQAGESSRAAIQAPLLQFNQSLVGPSQQHMLCVEVLDGAGGVTGGVTGGVIGGVIGGLWGHTSFGWLYTQLLVVPEALRGQGVGRQLLQAAEALALQRGCHGAWLDTFNPQALLFYERVGYRRFGQLDDFPAGGTRYFLKKELAPVKTTRPGPAASRADGG